MALTAFKDIFNNRHIKRPKLIAPQLILIFPQSSGSTLRVFISFVGKIYSEKI